MSRIPVNALHPWLTVWFCLAFLYGISGCTENQHSAVMDLVNEGDRLFEKSQYRDAIQKWQQALSATPNSEYIIKRLGMSYLRLGDFRTADEFFRHYLKNNPGDLKIVQEIIRIRLLTRDWKTAEQLLSYHNAETQNDVEFILLKGDLCMLRGAYPEAEKMYASVLLLEKDHIPAKIKLAMCMVAQGRQAVADQLIDNIDNNTIDASAVLLQIGDYFTLTRRFSRAETLYLKAIQHASDEIGVSLHLVHFYLDRSDYEKAISHLLAITNDNPTHLEAKKLLVQCYLSAGRLKQAESVLDELHVPNSVDSELHLLKGRYHLQASEPTVAETYFEHVLRKQPDSPSAHYWAAIALLNSGQVQLAKQHLIKALALANNFVEAELAIAGLYYRLKEFDLSVGHLDRIICEEPENIRAHKILAGVLLAQKKYTEAISTLKTAEYIDPDDVIVKYYLARAYEGSGDVGTAKTIYRIILSKAFIANACLRYAGLLIRDDQFAEAECYFNKLLNADPSNSQLVYVLAEIYYAMGKKQVAIDYFERCLQMNPKIVSAYIKLAGLYREINDNDRAVEVLRRCAFSNNNAAAAYLMQADLFYADKKNEELMDTLSNALTRFPDNDILMNNLAFLYLEQNTNHNKALELAQTAYQRNPHDPIFADTLGWAYHKKGMHRQALWYLKHALAKLEKQGCLEQYECAVSKFHMGAVLFSLEDYEKAAFYLKASLSSGLASTDAKKALSLITAISHRLHKSALAH